MADTEECSLFEPQSYLKDRCKKCFKLKSKHPIIENIENINSLSVNNTTTKNLINDVKSNKEPLLTNGGISRPSGKIVATRTKSDVSNTKTVKENINTLTTSKSEKRRSFNEKGTNEGDENDEGKILIKLLFLDI